VPTKEELEQENARLSDEVYDLREQAAAAMSAPELAAAIAPVARRPWLSEGERQELERVGVTNSPFDGSRLTIDEARDYLAGSEGQHGVTIADPDPAVARAAGYTAPADSIDESE
jgi:hypothetical protein